MVDFRDDGRLYPFAIYQQLEMQKLAAEQPLPRQAVWSVRAGGTDRQSHYTVQITPAEQKNDGVSPWMFLYIFLFSVPWST